MSEDDKTKTELVMENVHLRRKLAEAEARAERMEKRYKGQLAHNEGLEVSIRARKEQIKELKAEREELLKSNPSEAERRILDMWPRFEDGEPVMRGDRTEDLGGEITGVEFFDGDGYVLWNNACTHLHLSIGKRVKRPAPEVLDADGVPIEVGDAVYDKDGCEAVVTKVERDRVSTVVEDMFCTPYEPSDLTHREPGGWERLFEDARQLDIYLDDTADDYPRMSCVRDIVRRAKALAGIEVE